MSQPTTATVPAGGSPITLDDGTAASGPLLDVKNTGTGVVYVWPSGQALRPGQPTQITISGTAVTATSPVGSTVQTANEPGTVQAPHQFVIDGGTP